MASLLWRARAGIRTERMPCFAGHGMADPAYRPPRLPYVSVVGPLNVELEPERDPPRAAHLWVQTPGHVAGAPRTAAETVPAPGPLTLVLDGEVQVTATVDAGALAGQPLTSDGVAVAVAAAAEDALRDAIHAGAARSGGVPVTDPERVAELAALTVRWDATGRRFVISSGRRGTRPVADPDGRPSGVAVPAPAGTVATALGLAGVTGTPGRLVRHRRPLPTAVAVDVRVDLWAGSQLELADALDTWIRVTPTRGQLLERPALLAADVAQGATALRLQLQGDPGTRWTLLQLEPTGGGATGLTDRRTGRAPVLDGATATEDGIRLDGAASAQCTFFDPPPVPLPWLPEHPAIDGYAVTAGLRFDAGAAVGDTAPVLTLEHAAVPVLSVQVEHVAGTNGGEPQARIRAEARRDDGTHLAAAVATVAATRLVAGVELHVVADAATGVVTMFLDGAPVGAPNGDPAPGTPAAGPGLALRLGAAAGVTPAVTVGHVHVQGRPLGPPDPRSRAGVAPAAAWAPGDPVSLGRTEDGVTASGEVFAATVVAVDGDELILDRPVVGSFPRAASLVFARPLFFSQRQLRRQDDLMNRLYRICAEYRVSTFLDERFPSVSAPLVETPRIDITDFSRAVRPAPGHPGTRAVLVTGSAAPLPTTATTTADIALSEAPHG
ncbi:hypothetical protein [Micromonospora pattaloongensis]|nr:hypothetical protein [Micromonospora pattaloongensis]